jgi:PAS domain S-box-containing protein
VLGKNMLEIFPGLVHDPSFQDFRKVLRGETVHLPANENADSENYAETYLIPIVGDRNETIGLLWIVHDLRKELQIMREQKKASQIINLISDVYFILDREYRFLYINERSGEVWGVPPEELLGKDIRTVFPAAMTTQGHEIIKNVLTEGIPASGEFFSGITNRWAYISANPSEEGVVVLFSDIHNRKNAESRLHYTQHIMQLTAEASPDAITIYDIENNVPVYLNNCLADWLGYTSEELISMGYEGRLNLIHEEDRQLLKALNEGIRFAADNELKIAEYRILSREGKTIWIRNRSKVFRRNEEGNVTHSLSILQEVTDQWISKEKLTRVNSDLLLKNRIYNYAEEIISLGTWTWNLENGKAHFSDQMYHLFGMDPQSVEPSFTTIPPFIHPDDREKMMAIAVEMQTGLEAASIEYRITRADGVHRVLRNKCKAIINEAGERVFIGTTQDITEEVQLRKQLSEQ